MSVPFLKWGQRLISNNFQKFQVHSGEQAHHRQGKGQEEVDDEREEEQGQKPDVFAGRQGKACVSVEICFIYLHVIYP